MTWTERDTRRATKKLAKRIKHLHRKALKQGHELILARDSKLIKIRKDGKIEVLQDLPKRHRVNVGSTVHINKAQEQ